MPAEHSPDLQTHARSCDRHAPPRIPHRTMRDTGFDLQLRIVRAKCKRIDVEADMPYSAFKEVLWAFSIYLESVAILPQLFMLQRTGEAETITTHYLFALGAYRALYIPNWIYRYFTEDTVDVSILSEFHVLFLIDLQAIAIVAGIVQ